MQVKYAFDKSGETERKTKDDYIAAAAAVIKITADKKTCKTAEKRSSSNNKNGGKQTKPFSIDTSTHSESLDNNNNNEIKFERSARTLLSIREAANVDVDRAVTSQSQ